MDWPPFFKIAPRSIGIAPLPSGRTDAVMSVVFPPPSFFGGRHRRTARCSGAAVPCRADADGAAVGREDPAAHPVHGQAVHAATESHRRPHDPRRPRRRCIVQGPSQAPNVSLYLPRPHSLHSSSPPRATSHPSVVATTSTSTTPNATVPRTCCRKGRPCCGVPEVPPAQKNNNRKTTSRGPDLGLTATAFGLVGSVSF